MARRKMLAPNETLWWVPKAGLPNYKVPTVAQINAGVNISCAVVTGYTLNPTDPDTDDSRSICDNSNAENDTFENYEGNLTFFRNNVGDTDTLGVLYAAVFTLFKNAGATGYIVRRVGKPNTAVAAAGDDVEVFGFESDNPQDVESDSGGPIQLTVPFIPQGEMSGIVTLA